MSTLIVIKLVLFVLISGLILWVSRKALKAPGSHGIYRFLAWESILILFLLNVDKWFYRPFSLHQVISWVLLLLSLVLVIQGVRLLRKIGKPDPEREDPSLVSIEKTTELVTEGLYAYIRHPLYSSLLFLAWGTFFKYPSWAGGCLAAVASGFLFITSRIEEAENIAYFGEPYLAYMKKTRMFVPFLF
jgi:protein-S-isoprenylcysteine O-methyltransferase Ste14